MFSYPVLLGDVGGTNARFAVLEAPDASPVHLPRLLTGDFASPEAALAAGLADHPAGLRPRSALLAVAARVDAGPIRLTNAGWDFDPARFGEALTLDHVEIVNDYVPMAAALEGFAPGDLIALGEVPAAPGARLVLGAGTGFGASALLPVEDRFLIHATEAGHVEFGPSDEVEVALWHTLERQHGRVTAETILSGPGLFRLCRALAIRAGRAMPYRIPNEIILGGENGDDLACESLLLFSRLLGRFAGDLALILSPTGGVFIGGGLAPRLVSPLTLEFRGAFEQKPPFQDLVRQIPTSVIVNPSPALLGLARIVTEPGRFIYTGRTWTR